MTTILAYLESAKFWFSLFLFVIAFMVFALQKKIMNHFHGNPTIMDILENKTNRLHFLYVIAEYVYWFFVIAAILQINGINIATWMAGFGVVGIIVGFALQDALKDWMMGLDIMTNRFFSVGDVIRFEGIGGQVTTGLVTGFNVKVTHIYDFYTGCHYTLCNRCINAAEVVSDWLDVTVPAAYEVPKATMAALCEKLAAQIQNWPQVDECKYLGIQQFSPSSIDYLLRLKIQPIFQPQIRRDVLGLILQTYEEAGLSVPYDQLDVWFKNHPDAKTL